MTAVELADYIINDEHYALAVCKGIGTFELQTELFEDGLDLEKEVIREAKILTLGDPWVRGYVMPLALRGRKAVA